MRAAHGSLALGVFASLATLALGWGCGGGSGRLAGSGGIGGTGGAGGGASAPTGVAGSCGPVLGAANAGGGFCGTTCPEWSPPGAPDGGFSPAAPDGSRITNDKAGCPYTTCSTGNTVATTPDDASLGFTATDLLAAIATPGVGQLIWYDGTVTGVHLSARYDNLAVFVQHGPGSAGGAGGSTGGGGARGGAGTGGSGSRTTAVPCDEMLANGAVLTLSTDDGRFAGEELSASLNAIAEPGRPLVIYPSIDLVIPLSDVRGSFRVPPDWQAGAGSEGILTLRINTQSVPCNPNCAPGGSPGDAPWANTESFCGYDGKIVLELHGSLDAAAVCGGQTVVATWIWQ
jgi:hypothetical protein